MANTTFGYHRKASGKTASHIAVMAGVSAQFVCDIEKGRRVPSPEVGWKLLTGLEPISPVVRARIIREWSEPLRDQLRKWDDIRFATKEQP